MEQRILSFLKGSVKILICGSSYDRFLNLCAFHGIQIRSLLPTENAYTAELSIRDFRRLRPIVRKSHVRIHILKRQGLPFFIHKYRKRRLYLVGIAAALLFMIWLSSHIWNITIEGNISQTDDILFEYLDQNGILHGMPKSQVDCKELADQIRSSFSQFSWVSVKLKGTRLLIQVKEGIQLETDEASSTAFADTSDNKQLPIASSLAASASGIISSIYVRKGVPLVETGTEVEPGTLLVSGAVPIYDDSGTRISWQYVTADADIVIQTKLPYEDEVLFHAEQKYYTGQEQTVYQLQLGTQLFALPGTFPSFESCDIFTDLRQLNLTGHFYLPIYLRKFTAKEYKTEQVVYTKEETEQLLRSNLEYFIKKLEEKGVQIFENDVKIEWNEMSARAAGILTLGEPAFQSVAVGTTEEELLKNEYG